ncbi:hypothetical protein STANM309S_02112 [Streptomyces tanashiensis]
MTQVCRAFTASFAAPVSFFTGARLSMNSAAQRAAMMIKGR